VLWHCWLGDRKSIRPVKIWVMRCWCGYLSAARCRLFAHGPADATAIPKAHHLLPTGFIQVVLEKRLLNGCTTHARMHACTHAHTHPFKSPLTGTTRVSQYQKGKTNQDFTDARDSEWQWHQLDYMQLITTVQTDNHTSIPPISF